MRILYLTDISPVGGTTTSLKNLLREFLKLKHRVSLIAFTQSKRASQLDILVDTFMPLQLNNDGLSGVLTRITVLFSSVKKLQKAPYELIICDSLLALIAFYFVRPFFKMFRTAKCMYIFHGSYALENLSEMKFYKKKFLQQKFWLKKNIESYFINQTNLVITYSKYSTALLKKKLHISTLIQHVYPGRELFFSRKGKQLNQKSSRQALGLSLNKKILLVVSRLEPRKGVMELFRTLASYGKTPSNWTIVIVTNFSENFTHSYACLELFTTLHLSNQVLWINTPSRNHLAHLYKAADVFLLPSLDLETFGFVTLEAMSMGTPVIGYNIGANSELIESRWLAKVGRKQEILEKTKHLFNLPSSQIRQLSAQAVQRAEQFSWQNFCRSLFAAVENLPSKESTDV